MSQKLGVPKKMAVLPKLKSSNTSPNLLSGTKKAPPKFVKAPPKMIKKGMVKKAPPQVSQSTRDLPIIEEIKPNTNGYRSTVNLNVNNTNFDSLQPDDIIFQKVSIKCETKRDNIAEEFLTSEQVYLSKLLEMDRVYRTPMLDAAKKGDFVLSVEQVHDVFSKSFDDILKVNYELLKGLKERIMNWSSQQLIGDILLQTLPFLKMYTIYTGSREKASNILEEVETRESYTNFILQCVGQDETIQDLRSYLIRPVQRIPRYRLLLEDLLQNTEDTHPDKDNLSKALDKIMVIAQQVNKEIDDQKNRIRIVQIQKKFLENVKIIEAGRVLIKEGELTKICRKDHKKFIFWLFSDLLMYAKEMPGSRYTRNRSFPLIHVSVADIMDDPKRKLEYAFQISSSKKSFVVYSDSQIEKSSWLNEISACLKDTDEKLKSFQDKNKVRDLTVLAPVWVPDSESTACFICGSKFTLINRKHHCRQCGQVVCGKCSSKKKELPGRGKKRVCDICFDKPVADLQTSSSDPIV